MEFRLLKYFLMVAREENITKAANLLHITQPTLSRQLMQLEEQLGVTLFKRSKHRIILTEDGMLLRRRAQEILTLMDKTQQELTKDTNELIGEISIGCGETQNMSYLSQKISKFRQIHSSVKFNIHSTTADEIKERIENGLLDIGLVIEPVDISKYNFIRLPQKEEWGILIHHQHKLASKTFITAQDLVNEPLIITKRPAVQNELINWFNKSLENLNIVATYNLILNAANMVQHQIGLALCFNLNFDKFYQDLRFIPLYPALQTGAVLIWKKDQIYAPATLRFIDFIKNAQKAF